jgi:hypothetical protein
VEVVSDVLLAARGRPPAPGRTITSSGAPSSSRTTATTTSCTFQSTSRIAHPHGRLVDPVRPGHGRPYLVVDRVLARLVVAARSSVEQVAHRRGRVLRAVVEDVRADGDRRHRVQRPHAEADADHADHRGAGRHPVGLVHPRVSVQHLVVQRVREPDLDAVRSPPRSHRGIAAGARPSLRDSDLRHERKWTMSDYPLRYSVDYPDRDLNRLTTALRIFTVIPIAIVLGMIGGFTGDFGSERDQGAVVIGGSGLLVIPPLLMIVFRQKYPRWWFEWNLQLLRFLNRVGIYVALMDDRYPSTDEEQAVHLDVGFPDAREGLNRWLPLVKWLLAIPHYIVLFFLYIGALFVVIAAWFAILFTGRYPRGLFDYVEGVIRWHNRVVAYAFIMVTDEYPPFRLGP